MDKETAFNGGYYFTSTRCNRNKYAEYLIGETKRIEKEWYESLRIGTPDYSCYDDEPYAHRFDCLFCWLQSKLFTDY